MTAGKVFQNEMPKYFPIQVNIEMQVSLSDMIALDWRGRAVAADFVIPNDDLHALRVQFDEVHIIRVLDEMPLSTEPEETPNEGVVPEHFAYRVEGARFWQTQSDAFKASHKAARHYRFVTGWECLDVIADFPPTITIVTREQISK